MASSTTDDLFHIQTSLPTNIPTISPSDDGFSTIDIHSDRPIPTAATTDGGLFSIETQTSLSSSATTSDGGLFTIQTQTTLTGPTGMVPPQTTPQPPTTGPSGAGTTSPVVSPSPSAPSEAGQFGASPGLLGFVLLAWMGFYSFRH